MPLMNGFKIQDSFVGVRKVGIPEISFRESPATEQQQRQIKLMKPAHLFGHCTTRRWLNAKC